MSQPTHTVVCTFDGVFKVIKTQEVPFKVKGTSINKAKKLKEAIDAE